MKDDDRETIRRLAIMAGLPLEEERVAALTPVLPFLRAGAAALAAVGYGDAEPAGRFRARSPDRP